VLEGVWVIGEWIGKGKKTKQDKSDKTFLEDVGQEYQGMAKRSYMLGL
jgi:hypothetical protein